jgi:hypothetical protein
MKSLSDAFSDWISDSGLEQKFIEAKIKTSWEEIVGKSISNCTTHVNVNIPNLYIKINNAPLKEMLFHQKSDLLNTINTYLKKEIIKDIIFL